MVQKPKSALALLAHKMTTAISPALWAHCLLVGWLGLDPFLRNLKKGSSATRMSCGGTNLELQGPSGCIHFPGEPFIHSHTYPHLLGTYYVPGLTHVIPQHCHKPESRYYCPHFSGEETEVWEHQFSPLCLRRNALSVPDDVR